MSHSSYTASERRGILVIALVALLIIGSGVVLALCGRNTERVEEIPVVIEHPEMVDTTNTKTPSVKSSSKKKTKTANKKKTTQKKSKTYRKRNPLEEPVSQ